MKVRRQLSNKWADILLTCLILGVLAGYFFPRIPRLSELLCVFYAVIGLFAILLAKTIRRNDIYGFVLAILLMIYAQSSEGLRYGLLVISIITWSKFKYIITTAIHVLVIIGFVSSLSQITNRMERIEGFCHGSPPQFACYMYVCFVFLAIYFYNMAKYPFSNRQRRYKTIVLMECAGCILLIFLTGTRSIFAAAVAIGIYYIICSITENIQRKQRKWTVVALLIAAGLIVMLFADKLISVFYDRTSRGGLSVTGSDSTRMALLQMVISDMIKNPITFIIGHGGGYVESFIRQRLNINEYFPLHQDFILMLSEYGIVGLLLLFCTIIKKYKALMVLLVLFVPCSFHNIILNTRAMLLMFIIVVTVGNNNYAYLPWQKRLSAIEIGALRK